MTFDGRLLERRERRKAPVEWRIYAPKWRDPYPWINGTLPEKMVYAELKRLRVPFTYQADGLPEILRDPKLFAIAQPYQMRPDVLLPELKIAIEVQGDYWHSNADGRARDDIKNRIYRAFGYTPYWIWEFDIVRNVVAALAVIPELQRYVPNDRRPVRQEIGSEFLRNNIDDTAGIAAQNRKRARPKGIELRQRRKRGRRR